VSKLPVWIGVAILKLHQSNPKKKDGFIGAFVAVACSSEDVAAAVRLLYSEFEENGYELVGFENFQLTDSLERELTENEKSLVNATDTYPAQFLDLHLHKSDA
jgi:hypothetical protein